ncbi:MAG: DUF3488 and transglutaminase-like domain-containing protein [Azoarcus sp.]|nr:DUF3488 and transglutaminase-like domain-containing protein [Azoarcus sp.]
MSFRLLARHSSPNYTLRRDQGAWLLAAAALTLAPHLLGMPPWVAILCPVLLAWRGWRLWHGQLAPARWLLIPLALAAVIGVRISHGHFFGKVPGLTLLAVLLSLKLLESRNMRDIRVAVLLCLFLQFGFFFNNQSLPMTLLALVTIVLTIGSLLALIDPAAKTRERLGMSVQLIIHGLPFMLVFFVLFPRLAMPLWGMPSDNSAITGLSDSMAPGTISELSLSDEIAFRAEFIGPPPPPIARYWRGPVMNDFDGRSWRIAPRPLRNQPLYTPTGVRVDYQLTVEPHYQIWLPVLDFPAGPVDNVRFSHDFQTLSRTPLNGRMQFRFSSYPETMVGLDENAWILSQARQLPRTGNPRARALAAELRGETPEQTLSQILVWMRDAGFTYTLQPPLFDVDSVDFFLFDARLGFCEHFASAFVFLMRSAGIPARIVTGYQGGTVNPINQIMVVRQSDAHAWAEVWLEGRGWVRVDPTALVAPLRITDGLAGALSSSEGELPIFLRPEFFWLRDLRFRWEVIANEWNRMVLTYNYARQRDLLEDIGLDTLEPPSLIAVMITVGVLLFIIMLLVWARHARDERDALDRAWALFSNKLARHGLARAPAEGPLDFSRRLAAALPAHAGTLGDICARYARLRYRPPASNDDIQELSHAIRTLDLK